MTLYELSDAIERFAAGIENGEIPEEAIADTLDSMEMDFNAKADGIACIIKDKQTHAKAIREESKKQERRAKSLENQVEYLQKYLSAQMQRTGIMKIETTRNSISFHLSERTVIEDAEAFMRDNPGYCREKVSWTIDKTAIRDALKSGQEIKGAHLEQSLNIQIK